MALNLVEVVSRSGELTHLEVHVYLCYCAYRDENTGISKPKNLDLEEQTGIDRSTISKAKRSLAAKLWLDLLGGRRVRPLVGYGVAKNGTEANFSEEEGVRTPKNPPAKNGPHIHFRPQTNFSEGTADVENGTDVHFSDSKNGTDVHKGHDVHFSPTPPIRNKYSSANTGLPAGMPAGGSSDLQNFAEQYGRDADQLCDANFVRSMKAHPEFAGIDVEAVWTAMSVKATKPKTCFRFWKWLQQEKVKVRKRDETDQRDRKKRGSEGGAGGTNYNPFDKQEVG